MSNISQDFAAGVGLYQLAYWKEYLYINITNNTTTDHFWRIAPDGLSGEYMESATLPPSPGYFLVGLGDEMYISGSNGGNVLRLDNIDPWVAGSTLAITQTGPNNGWISAAQGCLPANPNAVFNIKTADKTIAGIGEEITYSINVTNITSGSLADVYLTDTLVAGLDFVAGSVLVNGAPQPADDPTTGLGILLGNPVLVGESFLVQFKVKVVAPAVAGNILSNVSVVNLVNANTVAQSLVSNTSNVTVTNSPDFSGTNFVKSVDNATIVQGGTLTYTLVVTNNGTASSIATTLLALYPEV